jgi:hypothetical protein
MWTLPWAEQHYPEAMAEIRQNYPGDFITADSVNSASETEQGDPYEEGSYVDEWGCTFINIQAGIIGEVRTPLLEDLSGMDIVSPPYDILPKDRKTAAAQVNRFCAHTDKFVLANCCPRPWERYQFIRGTENAMMDIMMPDEGASELLSRIHAFYMTELEFWLTTDVDAVMFMDDWGTQNQLLIPPTIWRTLFKPLYAEYCQAAHEKKKSIFMHSDGHITEIYPDLIEVGVDAINSQLFCMDMAELRRIAKGKITFWGEIDRQHILNNPDPETGRQAVRRVAEHLYDPAGGIIAQFEFGPGANPQTAMAIFDEWQTVHENA